MQISSRFLVDLRNQRTRAEVCKNRDCMAESVLHFYLIYRSSNLLFFIFSGVLDPSQQSPWATKGLKMFDAYRPRSVPCSRPIPYLALFPGVNLVLALT